MLYILSILSLLSLPSLPPSLPPSPPSLPSFLPPLPSFLPPFFLTVQEVLGTDKDVRVLSNGSLHIANMTMELQGGYTCVASNMAGSGNATITVVFLGW